MKKLKLNKSGATSINFVILMIVASVFIMGGISFIAKSMAINEIQGIMDKAGIIALRSSVDETKFRQEELYIEKSQARNEFNKILRRQLKTGSRGLLKSYNIEEVNIYGPGDSGIRGLGISGGNNDQYFLEATVTAEFQSDPIIDRLMYTSISFFDFLQSDTEQIAITQGRVGDGTMEVIVRSVTRVVLR